MPMVGVGGLQISQGGGFPQPVLPKGEMQGTLWPKMRPGQDRACSGMPWASGESSLEAQSDQVCTRSTSLCIAAVGRRQIPHWQKGARNPASAKLR